MCRTRIIVQLFVVVVVTRVFHMRPCACIREVFYFYIFRFPWTHAQNTCTHSDATTRVRTVSGRELSLLSRRDKRGADRVGWREEMHRNKIGNGPTGKKKHTLRSKPTNDTAHGHGFLTCFLTRDASNIAFPPFDTDNRFVRLKTCTDWSKPSLCVEQTFCVGILVRIYSLLSHIHFVPIPISHLNLIYTTHPPNNLYPLVFLPTLCLISPVFFFFTIIVSFIQRIQTPSFCLGSMMSVYFIILSYLVTSIPKGFHYTFSLNALTFTTARHLWSHQQIL